MSVDGALQIYTADACLRLLAGTDLARLALIAHALPIIAPVRFRLEPDALAISTGDYLPLVNAARDHHIVCFEADNPTVDHSGRWVVQVTGPLTVGPSVGGSDHTVPRGLLGLSSAMICGWLWH